MNRPSQDPGTHLVEKHFAVVYTKRQNRERFPENCVELMPSLAEAVEAADPDNHRYAARVYGPSRSSEGVRLYYLLEWL